MISTLQVVATPTGTPTGTDTGMTLTAALWRNLARARGLTPTTLRPLVAPLPDGRWLAIGPVTS